MADEFPWLRIGHRIAGSAEVGPVLYGAASYQILSSRSSTNSILLALEDSILAKGIKILWQNDAIAEEGFGRNLIALVCDSESSPVRVENIAKRPQLLSSKDAKKLIGALLSMKKESDQASWSEAIYFPDRNICLATVLDENEDRGKLLIRLLTGGISRDRLSAKQVKAINPWLTLSEINDFLRLFGDNGNSRNHKSLEEFNLPGQPILEKFFRDHIIDYYKSIEAYERMKVPPPSSFILYGSPGTGKSFAAKRLAEFLGWNLVELSMGTIGSPFIHQTSVLLKNAFDEAAAQAPSVVICDEIDGIGASRVDVNSGHKIEEVSEFLRQMQEARHRKILVIGTTNRIEAVDPALLRKGRFDHVIEVKAPTEENIVQLLDGLLKLRPTAPSLAVAVAAKKLMGRPISDIEWVANESARLAVNAKKEAVDDICLFQAISNLRKNTGD